MLYMGDLLDVLIDDDKPSSDRITLERQEFQIGSTQEHGCLNSHNLELKACCLTTEHSNSYKRQ